MTLKTDNGVLTVRLAVLNKANRPARPMRLSQRRRLLEEAKQKAEQHVKQVAARLLAERFNKLKRELRRANLRSKMYRTGGLYKDGTQEWQEWIDEFTSAISNALAYVASFFTRVEDMFFAPAMVQQGMDPQPWNTDQIVLNYQNRIGRQIKQIGNDTLADVQQAVANWYTTEQSLPDLIDTLSQWFDVNRAEAIATTEVAGVASQIAYEQMQYMGITRWQWDAFNDAVTCEICADLNGQTFDVEDTDSYPPNHVNCLIPGQEVVVPNLSGGMKSFYEGIVIEFTTRSGRKLTVTPNHPILSSFGDWKAANLFHIGDYLVAHINPQGMLQTVNPNNHTSPAIVEEIFESLKMSFGMISRTMPTSPEYLHGDARYINGNIDVIRPSRELRQTLDTALGQSIYNHLLGSVRLPFFVNSKCTPDTFINSGFSSFGGIMGSSDLLPAFSGTHLLPFHQFGLALSSPMNIIFSQDAPYNFSVNSIGLGDFIFRNSAFIQFDKITNIRKYNFSGHVYDFSSDFYELYTCNGIIAHNCRCGVLYLNDAGDPLSYGSGSI